MEAHEEIMLVSMAQQGRCAALRLRDLHPDDPDYAHVRETAEKGQQAVARILETYIGLVRAIALQMIRRRPQESFEDLLQSGCVGLLVAIYRYNPSYGTRISTLAVPWIKAEMKRVMGSAIRLPAHMHYVAAAMSYDRSPNDSFDALRDSANEAGMSCNASSGKPQQQRVTPEHACRVRRCNVESLDALISSHPKHGDIPDSAPPVDELAIRNVLCGQVRNALTRLPRTERMCVQLHYLNNPPIPLVQIARLSGHPRTTIQSAHERAKKYLREQLGLPTNPITPFEQ